MNINELQARRELDYLIQEQVFKKCAHRNERYYACQGDSGFECADCGADLYGKRCPKYSTDMAAAWAVVDKLIKLDYDFRLDFNATKKTWFCEISGSQGYGLVTDAEEAPIAICRAALQAVGVEP